MASIPLTITGLKEAQQGLSEISKEFEKFKNDPAKSKQLAKDFNSLSKEVDDATTAFDELNKNGKHLTATFEEIYGDGAKPLTNQIGELEDRLYAMALAGQSGTDEFKTMSAEVGKMKGVIIDVDKSIDLLSENRGLSIYSTGLSQVGERLIALDFEGAAKDAKALNDSVGNLSKVGKSAITGLAKTVGQLSKAFISMGTALLTNPIFLIAVAIAALVAIIVVVLDKLGFLQPILDAVGAAFGVVSDAVNLVIQSLKDLLDWIGLTNFAMQDLAKENTKAIDKMLGNLAKKGKAFDDNISQEIRLANIQGKNTTKLELKKQEELIKRQRLEKRLLEEKIKNAKITGDLDEDELAKLQEQVSATKEVIRVARNEYEAINVQADQNQLKADGEAYQRRLDKQKAFNAQRLSVERQIQDMRLGLIEDDNERELALNAEKFKRLRDDAVANKNLTEQELSTLTDLYNQQELKALSKLIDDKNKLEQEKAIEFEDAQFALLQQLTNTREEQEIADLVASYEKKFLLAAENAELEALLYEEQKVKIAEINDKYRQEEQDKEDKADAKAIATAKATQDAKLDLVLQGLQLAADAASLFANQSEKAARIAFNIQRTASIASATVSGIEGTINAYKTAQGSPITGLFPAYPAIQAGLAGAFAAVNIAKIASTQFGGGSGGGSTGGGSAPSMGGGASATSTQQAAPSYEFFGQNNNANNLTSPNDVEQSITVNAVVSETEVTATQNKIKKMTENATL